MDDICTVLHPENVQPFHCHLNSIEPSIQFTFELEANGVLPFLDTEVMHHPDGSLSTKVYRKKTHTGKYLDFQSHHPLAHKLAVPRTLFIRAQRLCSNPLDRANEEKHLEATLLTNGYPRRLIHQTFSRTRSIPQTEKEPLETTVVIPYIHRVSEPIRRILAPLNIRTCFRPHRTLRNILTHVKDPIALEHRTGVVYSIPCHDCPVTYVGQTGRTLSHRLKEHQQAFRSTNSSNSAVAEHAISSGHTIAWDEASVIDSNPHLHPRCALEAWHIRSQPHPLNRERGNLSPAYDRLIARTAPDTGSAC